MTIRKLLTLIGIMVTLNACAVTPTPKQNTTAITARITLYHKYEDKYGSKLACSTSLRAKEGVTVAAARKYPFGTKLYIPTLAKIVGDGYFTVQDRGTAVERKTASHHKTDVFDVFVDAGNKKATLKKIKLLGGLPSYMKVYVDTNKH